MRVLQVTSDWKWTGPAAPMLELLLAQRSRGCTVELACPEPEPGVSSSVADRARAAGISPILTLARARGVSWWRDREDARRLADLVESEDFGWVHTWHTRDHVLAVRALAQRRRSGATRLVRSHRSAETIAPWPWNRWLFGSGTDALLCVSPATAERNRGLRRGRPILGALGAVDLDRFAPRPPDPEVRRSLGLGPDDLVIGVVARVQRHRRFDLLLAALHELRDRIADARLLVIGRGTHLDEIARTPARELGLSDRVVFAGYRGDDYVDTLRACDLFTYLVPGSDGTCRALLEAAACGLPAVVGRRGALPEIVVDGETGLVVEEGARAMADAWQRLLEDADQRRLFGRAARRRAETHFAPGRLASQVEDLYASLK